MLLERRDDRPARSEAVLRRPSAAALLALLAAVAVLGAGCGSGSGTSTSGDSASVKALLGEGIAQANSHKLAQASTTFEDVLRLSPNNTYALYDLGVIDQKRHDAAGALSYYGRALRADGSYTPAMYNKAILLEAGNHGAALALYKRIVKLDPNASTAYLRMAFIYAKQGKRTLAREARASAVALDPSLSRYHLPK
jgi:tetratricopeptide (TPR) repeat protein